MANVVTALENLPIQLGHTGMGGIVSPKLVTLDTADSDILLHTPSEVECYSTIVGIVYQCAAAHSLIIKSEATELLNLPKPVSDGERWPLGSGLFVISNRGERLYLRAGTAPIPMLLIYVMEMKHLQM